MQAAALVELARRRSADLARGRLRHAARPGEHDRVGGHADGVDDGRADGGVQRRPVRRHGPARLGDDDEALGAGPRILDAERGDAAAPDPGHVGDRLLDLLRVDVAAAGDDHVLGAAGDEEVAVVVDEAEVAGVESSRLRARPPRSPRRSRSSPASTTAPRNWTRPSTRDGRGAPASSTMRSSWRGIGWPQPTNVSGCGSPGGAGSIVARVLERLPAETLDAGQASGRRRRHAQAALGQAVDGPQRLGPEAERREARREALDRAGEDGLGAVQRDAPRRQVEPSRSASAILRAHRSKAKFGAAVMVPRCREMASSQRTGLARKASGDIETIGMPW